MRGLPSDDLDPVVRALGPAPAVRERSFLEHRSQRACQSAFASSTPCPVSPLGNDAKQQGRHFPPGSRMARGPPRYQGPARGPDP